MSARLVIAGGTVLAIAIAAAPAQAAFGPGATVASASTERQELADDASQFSALSASGAFVAIQTRATNLFAVDDPDPDGTDRIGGIFRRDVDTGSLGLVAAGDLVSEEGGALLVAGARNPSISADGRYVAFSTAAGLVPADANGAADVYVRDMSLPPTASGAYTLVSVPAGGAGPIGYADGGQPDGQRPGADVFPLTSISADGRRVVFRTTVASDAAGPDTPPGQLLLRDLDAQTTRLLTRASGSGAPAGGANGSAAISADGTTVAWAGANAQAQTRFLDGESDNPVDAYYLWQRVVDGPAAPTRRISGAVDLDDPGCAAGSSYVVSPVAAGPCYGPLNGPEQGTASITNRPLAMTADGRQVFFLTPAFPRPSPLSTSNSDVFSADMSTGVTRKAGSVEWTREGAEGDQRTSLGVDGLAVSPDGRWLALSTSRVRFTGGRLRLGGAERALADQREVYVADLATGEAQRAAVGYAGGDARGGAAGLQVSVSADGSRVGFTSASTNLFFGDANGQPDAFVARRAVAAPDEAIPLPPEASNADIEPVLEPVRPRLRVTTGRTRTRAVRLRVRVPAAGRVTVRATGRLPAAGGRKTKVRTLASGAGTAKRATTITIVLRPSRDATKALRRLKGVNATARITFRPAAGAGTLSLRRKVRLLPAKRTNGGRRKAPVKSR